MHTRCARFPARSAVLGIRPSAPIRYRAPDTWGPCPIALLSYGCRIQDAHPVCAFSSVPGARCSALGVGPAPVPGTRSQVPDSRYPIPGTGHQAECPFHASKNPHTGYARCRIGRVRILATWYPGPGTWHPCSIPTSQIFRSCAVGRERIQAIREPRARIVAVLSFP